MEKIYIEQVLDHCRGHRTQTAKILGITRTTLYNKLKLFGLAANNKEKGN
jgi:DNA-binding NtrC family response regulator